MRTFLIFCAALGAGVLRAQTNTPAGTETQSPALAGVATNGQTEIRSDGGSEFYYKIKTYIYRQNVRVDNPQMKLTCELLTIESPELASGKFNRATAETNVVIDWLDESGTNHATADKAVYTYLLTNLATPPQEEWQTNAKVVLTGNPIVTSARGTFTGDEITWDRMRDVITSSGAIDMRINQRPGQTNGLFEFPAPKPAAK